MPNTDYYQKNVDRIKERERQRYWEDPETAKARNRSRYRDAKVAAVQILGGKCQRCGFTHPGALQFHHRDPSQKLFNISSKTLTSPKKYPWDLVAAEIKKCDLLCANCHFIEHNKWEEVA